VGGTYKSWMTDFARTYSTGNPTPLQRDTYRTLATIQKSTIEFVKAGVAAEDVFFFCKESFGKHGIKFHMPHIGHSFGIELHENPMLRPGEKTKLKPGMVFNVEPLVFDGAGAGYHLEDLLVVTDKGSRLLTNGLAPRELPVIGVPLAQQK
jgi:Xaa-Pro aminopeptidase